MGNLQQALKQAQALLHDGAHALALEQVREIQQQFPHDPQAAFVACVAQRHLGELRAALRELRKLVAAAPAAAPVRLEYGRALRAAHEPLAAIAQVEEAVRLEPRAAGAWQVLGELYSERGEEDLAADAFRHQMALAGAHPGLLEAAKLVAAGRLGMAEGICRDYLYRYPTDVNAIRLLADIGLQLEVADDAVKLLRRCLELAPDFHLARNNYANALSKANRFTEALAEVAQLERVDPQNLAHPVLAASVLVNVGDYAGAIERYDRILQQVPQHSRLHMSHGHALKTVGRQAAAVAAYRAAIAAEPALGEAYWSLANLKTFRFEPADLVQMRGLLDDPQLPRKQAIHVSFALGKAHEDAGEFDDAFTFYQRGNSAHRAHSSYSADLHSAELCAIAESCTTERFAQRRSHGLPAADPIFIVGLPRSGSTLLEQILASHSHVDGTMELPNVLQFVRRLAAKKDRDDPSRYPAALWRLSAEDCAALGQEFLDVTRVQRHGAPMFIDKMPNNFAHIGLIHLMLPNATIIDARRHAMATCFSGYKQLFAAGQEFTYDLDDIGRYYADYVTLMRHWDAVLPNRVLRVTYEEVVDDLPGQVARLLTHCGLEFEEQCLHFHRNRRAVRTASSEQVRQPIYRAGVDQWRNFEAHLTPLLPHLRGAGVATD